MSPFVGFLPYIESQVSFQQSESPFGLTSMVCVALQVSMACIALSFIGNFSRRVLHFLRQYSGCMSLLISWSLPLLSFVVRILFLVTSLNFGEILFSGFYLLLFVSKTSLFSFQLDFFSHTTCFLRCDVIICTRFLKVIKFANFRCTFSRCLLSMHFMVYHKVLSSLELQFCTCLNAFLEIPQQPGL